jgi:hypothetical protein
VQVSYWAGRCWAQLRDQASRLASCVGTLTYLCYPPDVLVPVLLGEAQVFVQAEAHVVAVETVGGIAQVEQVLLERGCDCGLAGGGEAGEPDGEAFLLAETVALSAGQRWVPCDVAGAQC